MTAAPQQVGDVVHDQTGAWVIASVVREVGAPKLSRLRVGSIAHHLHAEYDERLRAALPEPAATPKGAA